MFKPYRYRTRTILNDDCETRGRTTGGATRGGHQGTKMSYKEYVRRRCVGTADETGRRMEYTTRTRVDGSSKGRGRENERLSRKREKYIWYDDVGGLIVITKRHVATRGRRIGWFTQRRGSLQKECDFFFFFTYKLHEKSSNRFYSSLPTGKEGAKLMLSF